MSGCDVEHHVWLWQGALWCLVVTGSIMSGCEREHCDVWLWYGALWCLIVIWSIMSGIHISEVASLSNFLSQFKHLQADDTNCFLTIKFASHFFFVFLLYYPFKITLLWYEAAQVVNPRTTWLEWGWNFPSERLFYSHWTVLLSPEYEG